MSTAIKVSPAMWHNPPPGVYSAGYDRTKVVSRVVHVGFGNFAHGHLARYADLLLERGLGDWGICGVGTRDTEMERGVHKAMLAQDRLYTVVEADETNASARVIGSVGKYIFGPHNPKTVFTCMAHPEVKIVTMTVGEGGYYMDDATGQLKLDDSDIHHDLHYPSQPRTIFGYLAEGLERRWKMGIPPFTVLSCDNLPGNGEAARWTLLTFCEKRAPRLARWVKDNVLFPSCMVDRITPGTNDETRAFVQKTFGVADEWPIVCEPWSQWVIENPIDANGHRQWECPSWDEVGAVFVDDVKPWERVKMSVLNATHSAMGYAGYLCCFRYIHDIARAPIFLPYLSAMLDKEVIPLMPEIPGLNLKQYKKDTLGRFTNPVIKDTVLRICQDGSAKLPKFIFPSIEGQLQRNGPIRRLTFCVAAWLRFLYGIDEQGQKISIEDTQASKLTALAQQYGANPRPFLELTDIFGNLGQSARFVDELEWLLKMLYERGVEQTLSFVVRG